MYPIISKVSHQQWRHAHHAPILAAGIASLGATLTANQQQNDSSSKLTPQSPFHIPIRQKRYNLTFCENSKSSSSTEEEEETEPQRFERTLSLHRTKISTYRSQWEYKMPGAATSSTVTPSKSWPDDVPPDDMLPMLLNDIQYCSRSPNFRSDKEYCDRLAFRVASALITQFDEMQQKQGLEMLKSLAEKGYADAMAYYGMCLMEGRGGVEPNPLGAVSWFRRCSDMYDHAQSQYELGVAYYTGEGVVENGEEAVKWFLAAAEKDHPAACYMLGDCLLDGEGVEMDRAAALEWLIRSAELGHRGARSRVMAVLEKQEGADYGRFTDASRQTLVEHTLLSATKEGEMVKRTTSIVRRHTGIMNCRELKRRQTIVQNSRDET